MQVDINETNLQMLLQNIESKISVKESTMLITGIFLNNILVKNVSDINQINGFISKINQCVDQQYISNKQRERILKHLMRQQYFKLEDFQSSLIKIYDNVASNQSSAYSQTEIKRNKIKQNNPKLSRQQVQQLMKKQEQQMKTLELIKQLQLKQQQSYQKRKPQEYEFDCAICLQKIQTTDLAYFTCQHSFHRNCTFKHFSHNIDNRNFPLKCPECNQQCQPEDIFQFLNSEYAKKYDQRIFQQFVSVNTKDMSWCPTAGCKYVFFFSQDQVQFNCQLCKKQYCLKCKVPFHNGMNCKQFSINRVTDKNDQKFIEFVKGAKCKQCPNCKFWVQKTKGCDHMTCRCKYQFCYVCGGKYKQCPCPKRPGLFGNAAPMNIFAQPLFPVRQQLAATTTRTPSLFSIPQMNITNTNSLIGSLFGPSSNSSVPSLFGQATNTNLFS